MQKMRSDSEQRLSKVGDGLRRGKRERRDIQFSKYNQILPFSGCELQASSVFVAVCSQLPRDRRIKD